MTKKALKQYTAAAIIFYSQEAAASYTIMAENDEDALAQMREIVGGPGISLQADSIDDVDKWFNVSGTFRLARGDEIPFEDDDKNFIIFDESFENDR